MPTISMFYGILIQMFWDDHAPPHFHVVYAEYKALIDIKTLEVIDGAMPRRALVLVLEWASEHRKELLEDWELCKQKQAPKKIVPLQ
ncbi:MAG: transcriptional regulator [Gammaproteobacteria bacterium RIFOXYB2_FULL_38_6]|nr:MAG: transcriptional regulator [Gammaproteobacteria bacterium RIFOXYB2_FULL_38_6]